MTSQDAGHRAVRGAAHPLAQVRRSRGWSYQELARVVAENAKALGVPMAARREKVWRWEHWGVVPEPDSQRALARALGVPPGEVDARPWPAWLPGQVGMPSGQPWTAAGSLSALEAFLDHGAADPRDRPVVVGQALHEAITQWSAMAVSGCLLPRDVKDSQVDERMVAFLEDGLLELRRLGDRLGAAAIHHRVEADLRLVAHLLRRGARRRPTTGRLYRVAAELTQLGGWATTENGRQAAAERYYLTGLRLAHSGQDRPVAASLLAGLSLQAVYTGRPQDAVIAADAAVLAAQGTGSPRTRAMVATRKARAYAALGDRAECQRSLTEAEERLALADQYRDPPWISWFGRAELDAETGLAFLDLDIADQAALALERALSAHDQDRTHDRVEYLAAAATAHLRAGRLESAQDRATTAAAIAKGCASRRLAGVVEQLHTELGAVTRAGSTAERERRSTWENHRTHGRVAHHPGRDGARIVGRVCGVDG